MEGRKDGVRRPPNHDLIRFTADTAGGGGDGVDLTQAGPRAGGGPGHHPAHQGRLPQVGKAIRAAKGIDTGAWSEAVSISDNLMFG